MDTHLYRRTIAALLAALAGLVLLVWAMAPSGDATALPNPLEAVFPLPGDTVVKQTVIEVDLPVGYTLDLEVDGIRIPSAEIGLVEGIGRYSWGPGPGNLWETWTGGEHTVTIRWDRTTGNQPDPGEFTWVFRVT